MGCQTAGATCTLCIQRSSPTKQLCLAGLPIRYTPLNANSTSVICCRTPSVLCHATATIFHGMNFQTTDCLMSHKLLAPISPDLGCCTGCGQVCHLWYWHRHHAQTCSSACRSLWLKQSSFANHCLAASLPGTDSQEVTCAATLLQSKAATSRTAGVCMMSIQLPSPSPAQLLYVLLPLVACAGGCMLRVIKHVL